MRVLFASAEVLPLIKTGGLADVAAGLPTALRNKGVDPIILLPGYPQALSRMRDSSCLADLGDQWGVGQVRLIAGRLPDTGVPVWLIQCPLLYERAGGPYQDEGGCDWPDNAVRFALFSHVAAELSSGRHSLGWRPDVLHVNDWHAALAPAFLARFEAARPATLLTIHNLAFQGNFPVECFGPLRSWVEALPYETVEFYGNISFLKAGISYSDRLSTVSPTYAQEILTPEHGFGLDGVLRTRADVLTGVLNGVDEGAWNPETDAHIPERYSAQDLKGKQACKAHLQAEFELSDNHEAPLVVFVNRLTDQKLAPVVAEAVPHLVSMGVQFALHGRGDRAIEERFLALARDHSGKVAVRIGYREDLAHRVIAGGDLSLTPSRFEPCGLTPLYAMRYGTLPVVRPVGGLADTVREGDHAITGTGFVVQGTGVADLAGGVERALAQYRQPMAWRKAQVSAMSREFGWDAAAARYLQIYRRMLGIMAPAVRATRRPAAAVAPRLTNYQTRAQYPLRDGQSPPKEISRDVRPGSTS
jgi:starch synthase